MYEYFDNVQVRNSSLPLLSSVSCSLIEIIETVENGSRGSFRGMHVNILSTHNDVSI